MIIKELINKLLEYPMDLEVYTQKAYGHNRYVLVKVDGLLEDRVGVVIQDLPPWFEKNHLEDEKEELQKENQELRTENERFKDALFDIETRIKEVRMSCLKKD